MIQLNEKTFFSFLLFAFSVVMIVASLGMRTDVVLIPRIMGTILLAFTAYQLFRDLIPSKKEKDAAPEEAAVTAEALDPNGVPEASSESGSKEQYEDEGTEEALETKASAKDTYLFIAWMVLFLALIYFINMVMAIVLSLAIYLKWMQKQSWKLTIAYSAVFGIAVYLIFVVGMQIHYFF